jgi:hypothetical protein
LGSFSFWFKSLLLFGRGELEDMLLFFSLAISKLVGELNIGYLDEDLYYVIVLLLDHQSWTNLHGSLDDNAGAVEETTTSSSSPLLSTRLRYVRRFILLELRFATFHKASFFFPLLYLKIVYQQGNK